MPSTQASYCHLFESPSQNWSIYTYLASKFVFENIGRNIGFQEVDYTYLFESLHKTLHTLHSKYFNIDLWNIAQKW